MKHQREKQKLIKSNLLVLNSMTMNQNSFCPTVWDKNIRSRNYPAIVHLRNKTQRFLIYIIYKKRILSDIID